MKGVQAQCQVPNLEQSYQLQAILWRSDAVERYNVWIKLVVVEA